MNKFESFLSFASEDEDYARELAGALKSNGFNIWYAPLNLTVGDKLLDSIEKGLNESSSGILLITTNYLKKGWTNYEMDILIRQHIDNNKTILPIWHGVDKKQIEHKHAGLSGIVAINTRIGFRNLTLKLIEVLSKNAPTIGTIPGYESPVYRFLEGRGEITIGMNGPATTLWEFLLHSTDSHYPIYIQGNLYQKKDLLNQAAQLLPHIPETVENWVGKDGYKRIWEMCLKNNINPKAYE